jgi:hypothetical protein
VFVSYVDGVFGGCVQDNGAWDDDFIYGCVCDSSWKVGLLAGETQTPEWFGADCSLSKCCCLVGCGVLFYPHVYCRLSVVLQDTVRARTILEPFLMRPTALAWSQRAPPMLERTETCVTWTVPTGEFATTRRARASASLVTRTSIVVRSSKLADTTRPPNQPSYSPVNQSTSSSLSSTL